MQRALIPTILFALACTASAQQASYRYFGTSANLNCNPQISFPITFDVVGLPRLGQTFSVRTDSSNSTGLGCSYQCNLKTIILGFSNTQWGPYTLPLPSSAVNRPGLPHFCGELYTSIDFLFPSTLVPGAPSTPFLLTIAIPNSTSLLGVRFYNQVFNETRLLGGTNTIAFSHGGEGVIGR